MATWPASLPQKPAAGSWSGGPQNNAVAFKPEVGDAITRRRGSAVGHVYSGRFTALTLVQLNVFKTFYETTIYDGTLSWDWIDPIYGDASTWRFILGEDAGYSISEVAPDVYDVSVKLLRVPD